MDISDSQIAEYNRHYQRALKRIRPRIIIDGESTAAEPWLWTRRRLRQGISDLALALAIAPFKWECHFWIAKAYQRLGEHEASMSSFMEALRIDPNNPSIAKEAANAALELEQFQLGISLLRPALAQMPTDATLHYNLAVHQLLAGNPQAAHESLSAAAQLEAHPMTGSMLTLVEKVLRGMQRCPRSLSELRRGA